MSPSPPTDGRITQLLTGLRTPSPESDRSARELFEILYPYLHAIARRIMNGERSDHTLQATALLHETYLRLVDQTQCSWNDEQHFLAVGARVMRHVLTDHARQHRRLKRGGDRVRVTLHEELPSPEIDLDTVLSLDGALNKLRELDERVSSVAELRLFGGQGLQEIADVVGVSRRTVADDWSFARRWLARELADDGT